MKKKFIRILLVLIFATWVSFMGIAFLVSKAHGNDFDLLEKGIVAAISSVCALLGPLIYSYNLFPRSKYLESSDIAKPSFKDVCSSVVNTPQGFDFIRLKTEIASKWVITFSDDVEKILKFRTKMGFFKSWGAATWLKYESNAGKLYLDSFSMTGMYTSDLARKMQKEIEKCLKLFEST